MFFLLPLVTELALSVRNVFPSQLGLRILRGILLLHGPFVLVHCWNTYGLVGARLESFAFSFGLGVASKLSGMMPQQQYAQQPQMMQTQRPMQQAEAQAASTRTVVETEEGFSFDVAFWEGAIRFGGAEICCGELSRIES